MGFNMILGTYLAIALLHMEIDATLSYEKFPYRVWSSLFWALVWPLTAVIVIACVAVKNAIQASSSDCGTK